MVAHRLGAGDGGFPLWEDGGAVVSASGWGGPTPNGIRIGPVYTPPELRGRGYATALVAELSQTLLDEGRRFCFLFTDLANPTSNAIYERIGYVRVCEAAMISFYACVNTVLLGDSRFLTVLRSPCNTALLAAERLVAGRGTPAPARRASGASSRRPCRP